VFFGSTLSVAPKRERAIALRYAPSGLKPGEDCSSLIQGRQELVDEQIWPWHADTANGGKLKLQMGNPFNRSLGAAPESLLPSSPSIHPQTLTSK
jgi:hypothetical protein